MTEAMKCYYDQVLMDLDFGQMNAERDWEYRQFLEEVQAEVARRLADPAEVEEVKEDESGDALSTAEEVVVQVPAPLDPPLPPSPPPGPPSPPRPPPGRKVS